jgi:hypothetical protein
MHRALPPLLLANHVHRSRIVDQKPLELFEEILGVDVTPQRSQHNLAAFRDILAEIRKLRTLDLTDTHPAVIFEPTAAYRKEPGQ